MGFWQRRPTATWLYLCRLCVAQQSKEAQFAHTKGWQCVSFVSRAKLCSSCWMAVGGSVAVRAGRFCLGR